MNQALKRKLDEIIDKEIMIADKRISLNDIQAIQEKYNIELPPEYKEFLTNSSELYVKENYGFPLIETSNFTPHNGIETMDYLYVGSLKDNIKSFFENYRDDMVPIGKAGGDFICIGIEGNKYGKIYYLYHEDEDYDKVYLIAQNFHEFIFSFEPINEEKPVNLDDIEIELDEDLWNDEQQ